MKVVDFLDVTFNLTNGTYHPYKKPNDTLLYINTQSNHPPQVIKQVPTSINNRLSQNSSNEDIFNKSKGIYENALKESGYQSVSLNFDKERSESQPRNRSRNIIWFNPPYSRNVITNVAKLFLKLLDKHFPKTNQLSKVFNRNTVKVSYCCTENISSIIKSHNKKVLSEKIESVIPCNCRVKNECPLNGQCQVKDIVYKCTVSTSVKPDRVYLGTAEGFFKTRFYNHNKSFKYRRYENDTTLSKYVWEIKDKHQETPVLKWSIVKSVPAYSNISKKCLLCLHEKLEILNYPNQAELLNKRSELVSKCRHANKFLLANYKAND